MPWNGSGTFNRLFSWVADRAAAINITASRFDSDENDIVSNGLGNTLTRDGQGVPTANLPMAGFRHLNVAGSQNRNEYLSTAQFQDGGPIWGGTATGGPTNYVISTTPAVPAYLAGQTFRFIVNTPNGPNPTINAGQGAKNLFKMAAGGPVALSGTELQTGQIAEATYDGTQFILTSPESSTGWVTGNARMTFANVAAVGWVLANDGTIGNGASGGTTRANADTVNLFTLLWNNISNADCPVSSGRGASAAADFAANKTIALPKMLGRALAVAGAGSGLTAFNLGDTTGANSTTISQANLPSVNFNLTVNITEPNAGKGHKHPPSLNSNDGGGGDGSGFLNSTGGSTPVPSGASTGNTTTSTGYQTTGISASGTAASGGSGTAVSLMQPSSFLNIEIKL